MAKTGIGSIKRRNDIIKNILTAITAQDNFLIMGHKNPDEDCISSMIAMSLLINKFARNAYLLIPEKINDHFKYLLNICRYNTINIISNEEELPTGMSAVFFMDTPKPSMRESFPGDRDFYEDESVLKIEIDHHLEADSDYCGSEDYCLVDEASSACELVGMIALKLQNHHDLLDEFSIQEIFSRNFVLAVLTGIIGDSKMGQYLKTRKEKWFYHLFSSKFEEMLSRKTRKGSNNFSSMNDIFNELQKLSASEDECYRIMMNHECHLSEKLDALVVPEEAMAKLRGAFDHETIVTVARYAADRLAEKSGYLSLVAYYDDKKDSDLIQFRIRRSHEYKELDLRSVLEHCGIENGGGHPGAIGFRFPSSRIDDLNNYAAYLAEEINELMKNRRGA